MSGVTLPSRVYRIVSGGIGLSGRGLEWGAALAAGLVFAAGPASAAVTLSVPVVRNAWCSPNGDGIADTAELDVTPTAPGDSVSVRVEIRRVPDDALIATPHPLAMVPSGAVLTTVWDPTSVADGSYRFDIFATDGSESATGTAGVSVDTAVPSLTLGALAPNPYDPARPTPDDSLRASATVVSDANTGTRAEVVNSSGTRVSRVGTFNGSGTTAFAWGGKVDTTDTSVASGLYVFRVIAEDFAGNADTASTSFTLDREAPTFTANPDTVQTDTMPFRFGGTVADLDRVVLVETSADSGATWVAADSLGTPGPVTSWSGSIDYPGAVRGFRRLLLRAHDAVGHASRDTLVVAFDSFIPQPILSVVESGGTIRDGETLRIRSVWDHAGLSVTASLLPLDGAYVRGAETVVEDPPGTYRISYRVTPSNFKPAGLVKVGVRASTGIVSTYDSVSVSLEDAGPRSGEVTAVSRNRFDPERGETVTVASHRSTVAVKVDVANLAGQIVRQLEGTGFVEWDGRGENGGICGSGVYFLHVTVEGDSETRKVAVVRGGRS